MILAFANVVMTISAIVFFGSIFRATYHQWAKRGTWSGLALWTLLAMVAGAVFMLTGVLSDPLR